MQLEYAWCSLSDTLDQLKGGGGGPERNLLGGVQMMGPSRTCGEQKVTAAYRIDCHPSALRAISRVC